MVLPQPDGAETSRIKPRLVAWVTCLFLRLGLLLLFDILDQLAHLLQHRLGLYHEVRDQWVLGLGSSGIELPQQLLLEELKLPSQGFPSHFQQIPQLGEVAAQPVQLLGDVGAIRGPRPAGRPQSRR